MAWNAERPGSGRSVTSKVIAILMTFGSGGSYSLTEIARLTGLPISTAHRLITELLGLGHCELWSASGLVLFRHAALLAGDGGGTLTLQQAETLVEAAIEECERFYPVFQFVLWADKTPQEAIAAALIETQGEA